MPGSSLVQANYLLMKHIKKDSAPSVQLLSFFLGWAEVAKLKWTKHQFWL